MSTKQEVLWMIDNLCVTHTGFDITKTTKDIITCAIDNYLDINVKTIDNLD